MDGIVMPPLTNHPLYKYEIKKNIYDADGKIEKVIGQHRKVGKMSDELIHRLRCGGASEEELKQFT